MPIRKISKWLVIHLYLKSLEAVGFKSFAEKVTVNFQKGVIAVVGPNGSGKSNITDAIRWVLGEQSTKYLRASAMQDVIFSGTQLRKPANLAQVSLVFDNSDHSLPIDYQEVEITRRLYRSGESEYYINKKGCRLKDVHNLFLDTGVGKGSLFVIGQNKVDEILNGRADEKRILIEDIAGIIKYKLKKQESIQRLDKVQENLLRICDIKLENENNIEVLAREAEKTRQYNDLYVSLKHNSIQEYLYNYESLQNSIGELEKKYREQDINKERNILDINNLEENQAKNNKTLEELDNYYSEMQTKLTSLSTTCEKILGSSSVLRERQNQLKNKIVELDLQQEKLIADYNHHNNINLVNLQKDKNVKEQDLIGLNNTYANYRSEYERINDIYNDKMVAYKNFQETLSNSLNEYLDKKNHILYLQKNIEQIQARIIRQAQEADDSEKLQQAAELELAEHTNNLRNTELQKVKLNKDIAENLENKQKLQNEIAVLLQKKADIEVQLQKIKNQNTVLERLHAAYQGFAVGARSILSAQKSWRSGIIGAVAEILTVPKEYILAIETALGSSMQNIITQDDKVAKVAVEYLKENKLGRVTFLPLNTLSPQKFIDSQALTEKGVLGTAESLVACKPELKIVANFLLGRILVVDNIDNALNIARKYNFKHRLVTISGEVINIGGSLTGGSFKNSEPSFLAREEEIKTNKNNILKLEKEYKLLAGEFENKNSLFKELEIKVQFATDEAQQMAVKSSKQQAQVEYLKEKVENLKLEVASCNKNVEREKIELQELEAQLVQVEVLLTNLENSKDLGREDLTQQELEINSLQVKRENCLKAINELELQKNSLQQEIKYLQEKILYTQEDLEKITTERSEVVRLIQENQLAEASLLKELTEIDERQKQAEMDIVEQKRKNSAIAIQRESLLSKQIEIQTALREKNLLQSSLERAASKAEMNLNEKRMLIDNLNNNLQEKFSLDLEQAKMLREEGINIKVCKKNIQNIQEAIKGLGLVNPKAIEDYQLAAEKLEFMNKQYQDLLESKDNLEIIIQDIDKAMTEKFKVAFKELNEEFGKTYKNLFAGGSARLELLEADDWLNSGVEIFVQPVGKKQQALSLLSGGERSLTVIALLFAILSLRKTSFCVLDEIDAPLDEANLHRFNRYLQEYGINTQFIIVTHRKPSMQIANTIYGVTMQEPGISKVLSVQIKDMEVGE